MRTKRFFTFLAAGLLTVGMASCLWADVDQWVKQLGDADPAVRIRAAGQLASVEKSNLGAVKALVAAAVDKDPRVQRAAIASLRKIKADRKVTIPLMAKLLSQADPKVAVSAVRILAEAGKDAVPVAIEAMQNEDACYWACLVLQDIGPEAKEAVPALIHAVSHDQPEVCREAILALGAIGPEAKDAVPALAKLVGGDDKAVAITAIYALGKIGKPAGSAIGVLQANAKSDDAFVRGVSYWAMAKIKPDDEELVGKAVDVLLENLRNREDRGVRVAAARSLVDLRPDHKILVPKILTIIEGGNEEVIADTLDAVAAVGKDAVPGLTRMLQYEKIRPVAALVLGRIGPDAAAAVPALLEQLEKSDALTQGEILTALGQIGPAAVGAVGPAAKLLGSEDERLRYAAAVTLGRIGKAAEPAVPALKKSLGSKDPFQRVVAAWALAQIAPAAEGVADQAIPVLIDALKHDRPFVRAEAATALGGFRAKSAVDALKKAAADDPDQSVRDAAKQALGAIGK